MIGTGALYGRGPRNEDCDDDRYFAEGVCCSVARKCDHFGDVLEYGHKDAGISWDGNRMLSCGDIVGA